jgi:colanic acid biosynthesis glycosyl transferase WcaI
MRVTFLTHYYAPEIGAPQTRLRATADLLRDRGHDVSVVTGPPHYPTGTVARGYRAFAWRDDAIDGIPVRRVPVLVRPNGGLVDRVIDQGSFSASAALAARTIARSDVFVVESPPLFLGLTARLLRWLTGCPYIFHVADPWPDFPIAMGALRGRLPIALARWIEARAYAGAALVTTVTPALVSRLGANPAARGRVRLLENGVDVARFAARPDAAEARRALGWHEARLTLAYVGTVGLAQGVGTLIEAVADLRDDGVEVHIIGEGADRQSLETDVRARRLDHIQFHPAVPAEQVPGVLAAADALVVMLKRGPLYEESLPTKLVEGLAAGRPIVASAAGWPARIVLDSGAGVVAAPEEPAALRAAIVDCLRADRDAMGRAARGVALARFDRRTVVDELEGYLAEAARTVARRGARRAADRAKDADR